MLDTRMFKIYIVFLFAACFVNNLYLPGVKVDLEKAEEVQNAICSITTKDIETTANATITRQLKGVCTSSELNLKFDKLQTKILQEIDDIRYILEINGFKVPDTSLKNENLTTDEDFNKSLNYNAKSTESVISKPVLKNTYKVLPRMEEVLMYNDTLINSDEGNKYFYYWKIENIQDLLSKRDMYKSSPDFFVLGHILHLQFYPNYLGMKYFAIMLKPDSPGFIKKHRLVILNQLDPGLDLASGVLYSIKNGEGMLTISVKNLNVEGFVIENILIIKLEVFLDS